MRQKCGENSGRNYGWKIDRRGNLVEYDALVWMLPSTVNYSSYQREPFPWKHALRSSKRRGEIGRRSLETMRGERMRIIYPYFLPSILPSFLLCSWLCRIKHYTLNSQEEEKRKNFRISGKDNCFFLIFMIIRWQNFGVW